MSRRAVGAVVAGVMVGLLAWAGFTVLARDEADASRLVGRPVPAMVLADAETGEAFSLAAPGKILVVNFWAPWCVPCLGEHTMFNAVAPSLGDDAVIVGITYQSEPADVSRFLDRVGRATRTLADSDGRASIEFGVTGVPETFFVDTTGIVRRHVTGPVSQATFDEILQELRS